MPLTVSSIRDTALQTDWQKYARCRSMDTNVFFPPDDVRGGARLRRERIAKTVCGQCPVLERCRIFALYSAETFGVWGGLSESERRRVKRPYDITALRS